MSKEQELIKHRCIFTGHRPQKLNVSKEIVVKNLREQIYLAIQNGYTTFISGMAPGVDIWAAEIVLEFRETLKEKNIKLICAIPFINFGQTKDPQYNAAYQNVKKKADYIKYISSTYSTGVFQKRNVWMVDHSSLIIAVCHRNGEKIINGGTKNTIEYAQKQAKQIIYIEV